MRDLPCMNCGEIGCDCFPSTPNPGFKYNRTRDHNFKERPEFIAWDGEGITVETPMFTVGRGRYMPPLYMNKLERTKKEDWETYWDEWHMPDGSITKIKAGRYIGDIVTIDPLYPDSGTYEPPTQPYVLLANSKGDRIISDRNGLATADCFELMLRTKQKFPNSIFVGFGLTYDVNQMLKDLEEEKLWNIHDTNRARWRGYRIFWIPGKMLTVSQPITKRSFTIYDTFGYFQSSFLDACRKYLGDDPVLKQIEEGKAARQSFDYEELETLIIPYNDLEVKLLVKMMNILRDDLATVGIRPNRWHGPGAVSSAVLKQRSIPISRSIPTEVLDASQYAYAGGRFEHFWLGRYTSTVYEYDIRSAYPAAATQLPNLSLGTWEHVERFEPGAFGVYRINYHSRQDRKGLRPEPLFCRSDSGLISYPCETQGWYWSPEAELCADSVEEGWIFRPSTDERPFSFIKELYEARRLFKLEKNSAERALKLILNSIYGKLAQSVGYDKERNLPPRWHQLEYAGYITSYTRAKIYRAIALNPDAIISVETDAVFSCRPLDLPISDELGDWELTLYDEITYLQSGYYYAVKSDGSVVCKYRGMDRDRETLQPVGLPFGKVLDHLRDCGGSPGRSTPPLYSTSTRYIGLGLGLRTYATWRSWEKMQRCIQLDNRSGESKRIHLSDNCSRCARGYNMYDHPHRMQINGHSGHSYATHLPWREHPDTIPPEAVEWVDFTGDMAQWQIIR